MTLALGVLVGVLPTVPLPLMGRLGGLPAAKAATPGEISTVAGTTGVGGEGVPATKAAV